VLRKAGVDGFNESKEREYFEKLDVTKEKINSEG
jgi:hypothetical protein